MFVTMLVLTNMVGTKLFVLFPDNASLSIVLTSGIVTYPFTFWLTDIVSETYGKRKADLMVVYGFVASMLMLLILQIVQALPPADIWRIPAEYAGSFAQELQLTDRDGQIVGATSAAAQTAFTFTFDAPGLLLFASMLAYLAAQLTDNFMFHFWRRVTGGRHLWLRNNGSTAVSQLLDTIIVNSIFLTFYWKMPYFTATEDQAKISGKMKVVHHKPRIDHGNIVSIDALRNRRVERCRSHHEIIDRHLESISTR